MAIHVQRLSLYFCSLMLCTHSFASTTQPNIVHTTSKKHAKHHTQSDSKKHNTSSTPFNAKKHVVVSVGGGESYPTQVGDSAAFAPADPPGNTYSYHFGNGNQNSGFYNIFLGGQWPLTPRLDVQAGVAYSYFNPFNANGTVTQGVDAGSADAYNVYYQIQNQQLLLDTKWLYAINRFHPYFSVGLGYASNKASHFDVNIVPAFTTLSRDFENQTTLSFAYQLGLGLDIDITQRIRIGVGYRFNDSGKVSLGDSSISTNPESGTLSQSHFYTNNVIGQLTFLI